MTSDYIPANGTIVATVVAAMHSLAIGVEVDTASIATACECSISNIISGTGAAVTNGFIVREKVGNRYLWRRGPTQVPDEFIAANKPRLKITVDPTLRATYLAAALSPPPSSPAPAPAPAPTSMSERLATPRVLGDAEDPGVVYRMRDALLAPAAAPEPTPEPAPAPTRRKAAAPPPDDLRFGLFSDGSLVIERAGAKPDVFDASEAMRLFRFLDKTLLRDRDVAIA